MAKQTDSTASTHWEGDLKRGSGTTTLDTSTAATFEMGWAARETAGTGHTNPEELLAAAYATCYSMALANALAQDGCPPTSIDTTVTIGFVPGTGITGAKINVTGVVPGLSEDAFVTKADWTKDNCPVGKALAALDKEVTAHLAAK